MTRPVQMLLYVASRDLDARRTPASIAHFGKYDCPVLRHRK
jgi:hypothetical protein